MLRSFAPLVGAAVLLTGCAVVHPAPAARVPEAVPPSASAAAEDVPPSARPRLVRTGPADGGRRPRPRPTPSRPPRDRERAPAPGRHVLPPRRPAAPSGARRGGPDAAALCAQGVRLRRIPAGWAAICRAAMGG